MTSAIDLTRNLLDASYQMVKANLKNVTLDEVLFVPEGCYRSMLGTFKHIAGWSRVYYAYAFEEQPKHWEHTDWPRGLRDTIDPSTLTIDLVPHMDAGDRNVWKGDQSIRPLTELGRRQAEAIADALVGDSIDALFASPALRCRQTLEPLAEQLSLEITVLPQFGEESWRSPDGWPDGPGGAYVAGHAAGRAMAGIERIRGQRSDGRVVVCSHGHIIPNLIAFLIGAHGLTDVDDLKQRGQWFQVRFSGQAAQVELREAAGAFPS